MMFEDTSSRIHAPKIHNVDFFYLIILYIPEFVNKNSSDYWILFVKKRDFSRLAVSIHINHTLIRTSSIIKVE